MGMECRERYCVDGYLSGASGTQPPRPTTHGQKKPAGRLAGLIALSTALRQSRSIGGV